MIVLIKKNIAFTFLVDNNLFVRMGRNIPHYFDKMLNNDGRI
jgi:hypothetical protein